MAGQPGRLQWGTLLLALILGTQGHAQELGYWASSGVQAGLPGAWSYSVQIESRWLQVHETAFMDVAIARPLGKHLEVNLQWRTGQSWNNASYRPESRLAFRVLAQGDCGAGSWDARLMFQESEPLLRRSEWSSASINRSALRWRMGYTSPWTNKVRWSSNVELIAKGGMGDAAELPQSALAFSHVRNRVEVDIQVAKNDRLLVGYQLEWSAGKQEQAIRVGWSHDLGEWRPGKQMKERRRLSAIPASRSYDATGTVVVTEGRSIEYAICKSNQIFLSEVQVNGPTADFIELHNLSDVDCQLTGWRFDDDEALDDWVGSIEVVPAHGCWVAFSEGEGGFKSGLSAQGEVVYLSDSEGVVREIKLQPTSQESTETFDNSGASRVTPPSIGRYFAPGE
jgi:hypothetical protein